MVTTDSAATVHISHTKSVHRLCLCVEVMSDYVALMCRCIIELQSNAVLDKSTVGTASLCQHQPYFRLPCDQLQQSESLIMNPIPSITVSGQPMLHSYHTLPAGAQGEVEVQRHSCCRESTVPRLSQGHASGKALLWCSRPACTQFCTSDYCTSDCCT